MDKEKEYDGKLYRVVRRKDSHVNTKINPDGSKAAIQFTDNGNDLSGPVDIIEVDESEFMKTEHVPVRDRGRTLPEILWQDVIAPVARDALYEAMMTGYDKLCHQVEIKAVPKLKQKSAGFIGNMSIVASGIKDGLSGKEPKALQLLREQEAEEKLVVVCHKPQSHIHKQEKVVRSEEEVDDIVNSMRMSAVTLAACIRMLNNTVIADDGSNPDTRIEIQKNIKALTTQEVMSQIELLLEDKNRAMLDEASLLLLQSFKDSYFVTDNKKFPVELYVE